MDSRFPSALRGVVHRLDRVGDAAVTGVADHRSGLDVPGAKHSYRTALSSELNAWNGFGDRLRGDKVHRPVSLLAADLAWYIAPNRAPGFTNRTTELTLLGEALNYGMLRNGERCPVTALSRIC